VKFEGAYIYLRIYFRDDPGRRSAAKLLTKDEARRIAAGNIKFRIIRRRCDGDQSVLPSRPTIEQVT